MLEFERFYLEEDLQDMMRFEEVKESGDYFAIGSNGKAYYATFSQDYRRFYFCIPQTVDVLGYVPIKEVKKLKYIRRDSHSRPIYQDEEGKLWKDTDSRKGWEGTLYTVVDNEVHGEPLCPMKLNIRCNFIPYRISG